MKHVAQTHLGFRRPFRITFLLAVFMAAWVVTLGLGRWPFGYTVAIPRIVALSVFLAGVTLIVVIPWLWSVRFRSRTALVTAVIITLVAAGGAAWGVRKIVVWRASIWLGDYLMNTRVPFEEAQPLDVCFCFLDHFEPGGIWNDEFPTERRLELLERWSTCYGMATEGHQDSDGKPPQATWFFPVGHSPEVVLRKLSEWSGRGWGEVEYHLHHPLSWSGTQVRPQIQKDLDALHNVGACTSGYAFIHGVYGLADGDPLICHVSDELDLLQETGCYADFTFPNLYTPAQPSQVNSIFYARTTGHPKPYDRGVEATVGQSHNGLMLVQGPMSAAFTKVVLDDANLSVDQHPDPSRIDNWLDSHVHVRGRPNWVFINVHTHSATEYAQNMLFQGNMQRTWSALEKRFKTKNSRLHYVTAREVYNIIKAAEAGKQGNPNDYRDFAIGPPRNIAPPVAAPGNPGSPAQECRPVEADGLPVVH